MSDDNFIFWVAIFMFVFGIFFGFLLGKFISSSYNPQVILNYTGATIPKNDEEACIWAYGVDYTMAYKPMSQDKICINKKQEEKDFPIY